MRKLILLSLTTFMMTLFAQAQDNVVIDAALDFGNGKAVFFQDDQYGFYDLKGTRYDAGYPKASSAFWGLPASWGGRVDAAVNWSNGVAYLFRGAEYVKYNTQTKKVEGGARNTQSGWNLPAKWNGRVDAAVNWGNGYAYLFSGSEYVRYGLTASQPDGAPKSTQTGWNLPASWGGRVDAAVNWGNGKVYLFHGRKYVRYALNGTKPETSPADIVTGWKIPSAPSEITFRLSNHSIYTVKYKIIVNNNNTNTEKIIEIPQGQDRSFRFPSAAYVSIEGSVKKLTEWVEVFDKRNQTYSNSLIWCIDIKTEFPDLGYSIKQCQ